MVMSQSLANLTKHFTQHGTYLAMVPQLCQLLEVTLFQEQMFLAKAMALPRVALQEPMLQPTRFAVMGKQTNTITKQSAAKINSLKLARTYDEHQ